MSVFRSLFTWLTADASSRKQSGSRSRQPRARLELECLEGRALPSATNGLIAFTSDRDGDHDIYVMNPDGSAVTRLTNDPASEVSPRWSPDGSKIAFVRYVGGQNEIFVMNADGSGQTRLTFSAEWEAQPTWSPDGTKIAFQRGFDPELDIFVMNADGTGLTQLTNTGNYDIEASWSPDGSKILFGSSRDGNNGREIYVMNADGSAQTRVTNSPFGTDNLFAAWSPDGSKIAFTRGTTFFANSYNIYLMNADGTGVTQLTSGPTSNTRPAWSPDGAQITYWAFNFPGPGDVYVMNADGSGKTNLTNDPLANDAEPHWQPVNLATAPVSSWRAEGNANDSQDGNHGTLQGGVTFAPGKFGQAFDFDGSSGRVSFGNPANLNFGTAQPFSLEAWFNWDGQGSSVNNIMRKSDYPFTGNGAGYWLRLGRDAQIIEFFAGETTGNPGQPRGFITAPVTPNAWHHVVGVRNASGLMQLYLDGQLVGSVSAPGAGTTSTAPLTLGAWDDRFGVIEFFSGLIDEAAVYNRALTAADVQDLFARGGAVNHPPVAVPDTAGTTQNASVSTDVIANDTDTDPGDILSLVEGSASTVSMTKDTDNSAIPVNTASLSQSGNSITIDPGADFVFLGAGQTATVVIGYTVTDNHGATDDGTLTVTVTGTNDNPTADSFTVATTTPAVTIPVLDHALDADDGDVLTVISVTQGANGAVTINPNGTVTYTLTTFFSGSDTFTYTVSDGHGGTVTGTVTVNVLVPPIDGIALVQSQLDDLNLPAGQVSSLGGKLDAATKSLANGNVNAAVNQLGSFINQVQALKKTGRLDPAMADKLIAEIRAVIELLNA